MNESPKLNPYAVGSSNDQPSVPIRFRGTLTPEDWMIPKADAPPERAWKRLPMTSATIVLVVGCLLLAVEMAQRNDSESSYLWTIIGVGLLPGWVRFAIAFTPGKRKRNKRLKALSKQQREKCGWLNNQWLVEYDNHSAIRGSWSMVSNAMIFPTHLLLPQVVDNSRRIVLPWRFFASYQEIRQTIDILHAKVGVLVNRRKDCICRKKVSTRGCNGQL